MTRSRDGSAVRRHARLPRRLHPGAWWVWSIGLATAASRTTNPLLLLLVVAVAGYVVAARREDAPWARAYVGYLKIALVVVVLRVVLGALLGATPGTHVLFTLPVVPLPRWAAGVSLGGPVTGEGVVTAAESGLRLATLLVCVGAANSLANAKRLLGVVPGALYELGVAVVVALTVAPALAESVGRVRAARRLRGRPERGLRSLRGVGLPVLEDAVDRSIALAAAMDSRGYGRTAHVSARRRRLTVGLTLGGLVGAAVGCYGLLGTGAPPLLGWPLLVVGMVLAVGGTALGGRRSVRTRYRPDPFGWPEWAVCACGVAAAGALVAAVSQGASDVAVVDPLTAPVLPLLPAAGILLALLPAWIAPPVARPSAPADRHAPRREQEPESTAVAA